MRNLYMIDKYYENSEKVKNYCIKKLGENGFDIQNIDEVCTIVSLELSVYIQVIRGMLIEGKLPKEKVLISFLSKYNGSLNDIRDIAETDIDVLYKYWNILYPNSCPKEKIGMEIRDIIESEKYNRNEICQKTGISKPAQSAIENCSVKLTIANLKKYAAYFNMEPNEIMNRLTVASPAREAREKFGLNLMLARFNQEISIEEISSKLNIPPNKYEKIEQGCSRLTVDTLFDICDLLSISFQEMVDLASTANLTFRDINDSSQKVKQKATTLKSSNKKNGSLTALFSELSAYDYILNGTTKATTQTILTLCYLIFIGKVKTARRNTSEIVHYLIHITDEGNISETYVKLAGLNTSTYTNTIGEIYEEQREKLKMTYNDLSLISGCPRAHIFEKVVKNHFPNPYYTDSIFSAVELSPAIGIEDHIRAEHTKNHTDQKVCITIDEIQKKIIQKNEWFLWKEPIKAKELCKMFFILLSQDETGSKYRKIARLNLPQTFRKYEKNAPEETSAETIE